MKTRSLGFIGGGRITKILLHGFKNKKNEFSSITVCDTNKKTLNELKKKFSEINISDSLIDAAKQDIIFIALHPPVIGETISKVKEAINEKALIISLAPKFNIEKLSALLNTKKIVRMIPNATSIINKGFNPVCFSEDIDSSERFSILEILTLLGKTFVTEEAKLESYAITSAMLPTYFWFQWLEIQEIAKKIGLTEQEGKETVYETLKASLELMYSSGLTPEEVKDLIPVKPIAENEPIIKKILNNKLIALFEKIKA